ncbi:CPBP family intramembrane metalloprotease [Enterococcus sp. 669A]|uniref:CPBP family intramembrane metalloprotease n=1 Tax=Candidatus Enterococcus moelleringii TaxID=2815325 RepID=A0ABS3LES3_9ENTE|nr:CPBP family intramembrane glutamic endopeptidase [Enterococcus sp. 669A]MBO1306874.1 CPBP family intramembrane metalloprotease [Enterococcus sp. 669A]
MTPVKTSRKKLTVNLAVFIAIVLLSGWIGLGIDQFLASPDEESLAMLVWLVAPFLTIAVFLLLRRASLADLKLLPHFRGNSRWYLFALVSYPLVAVLVFLVGYLTGWIDFQDFVLSKIALAFIVGIIPSVIKNFFEEVCWRGYLTSAISKVTSNNWIIYLVVGFVWGSWHIPYYLFMLPGDGFSMIWSGSRWTLCLLSVVAMIFWSIQLIELRRITQSIWPCIISHSVQNTLLNTILLEGHARMIPGKEFIIAPTVGILSILFNLAFTYLILQQKKEKI